MCVRVFACVCECVHVCYCSCVIDLSIAGFGNEGDAMEFLYDATRKWRILNTCLARYQKYRPYQDAPV